MASLTARVEADRARVRLDPAGGQPGEVFYILRRDADGIDTVRDTSAGTVGYPDLHVERRNLVSNPVPVGTGGWGIVGYGAYLTDGLSVHVAESSGVAARVYADGPYGWTAATGEQWRAVVTVGLPWPGPSVAEVSLQAMVDATVVETIASAQVSDTTQVVDLRGTVTAPGVTSVQLTALVNLRGDRNWIPDGSFETSATQYTQTSNLNVGFTTDWSSDGQQALMATIDGTASTTTYIGLTGATVAGYTGTLTAGEWLSYGVDVHTMDDATAYRYRTRLMWQTATGAEVSSAYGSWAASDGRSIVTAQVPAGAVRAALYTYIYGAQSDTTAAPSGAVWATDGWTLARASTQAEAARIASVYRPSREAVAMTLDHAMVSRDSDGTIEGGWFDGDSVSTDPGRRYAWEGAQDASASVYGAYETLPVYDYEAVQGTTPEYILTDVDGNVVDSVRVPLPLWGTWIKSPARPYRNLRLYFGTYGDVGSDIDRTVYDIESGGPVVLYAPKRAAKRATLTLITRSLDQEHGLEAILSDGATLMLDTPPSWDVEARYISCGDWVRGRPMSTESGYTGLTAPARAWVISDVVQVPSPQGVSVADPGRTYDLLPGIYSTYVAIPATTPTYEALATGEVT